MCDDLAQRDIDGGANERRAEGDGDCARQQRSRLVTRVWEGRMERMNVQVLDVGKHTHRNDKGGKVERIEVHGDPPHISNNLPGTTAQDGAGEKVGLVPPSLVEVEKECNAK